MLPWTITALETGVASSTESLPIKKLCQERFVSPLITLLMFSVGVMPPRPMDTRWSCGGEKRERTRGEERIECVKGDGGGVDRICVGMSSFKHKALHRHKILRKKQALSRWFVQDIARTKSLRFRLAKTCPRHSDTAAMSGARWE